MKYLLSVLIFLIPFTSFAEEWVLLNNDFECTNDKNKSCYFNLYDNDNDTYLHAINLERHEFKNLKLSLFIEYLNSDELVDILDIILIVNSILGTINLSPLQFLAADLNENGLINVLDIIQLVNLILKF